MARAPAQELAFYYETIESAAADQDIPDIPDAGTAGRPGSPTLHVLDSAGTVRTGQNTLERHSDPQLCLDLAILEVEEAVRDIPDTRVGNNTARERSHMLQLEAEEPATKAMEITVLKTVSRGEQPNFVGSNSISYHHEIERNEMGLLEKIGNLPRMNRIRAHSHVAAAC